MPGSQNDPQHVHLIPVMVPGERPACRQSVDAQVLTHCSKEKFADHTEK
jgi:hypothetical protein